MKDGICRLLRAVERNSHRQLAVASSCVAGVQPAATASSITKAVAMSLILDLVFALHTIYHREAAPRDGRKSQDHD